MAGLGFKNFQAGTVLTAADINGYLMRQSVMRFATAAARDTALGASVSVGMTSYREDDAVIEVYDGTQWKPVGRDEPDQNYLINGNFDIWQRLGGSVNLAPGYQVDRWATISDKTNLSFGRATTNPPAGSRHYVSVQDWTAFPNGKHGIEQALELDNVNRLWGKFVTFSIQLRADALFNARVRISVQKNSTANTRTGGTWSIINSTTIEAADVPKGTASSDWKRFSVTAFVPADGTANGVKVVAEMLDAPGIGRVLQFAQGQLEIGVTPSGFKLSQGTIQGELAACQRYYYRVAPTVTDTILGVSAAASTTVAAVQGFFPVTMRIRPTALEVSFSASDYAVRFGTTNFTCSVVPAFGTSTTEHTWQANFTVASGLTAAAAGRGINLTLDAFLGWDVEL